MKPGAWFCSIGGHNINPVHTECFVALQCMRMNSVFSREFSLQAHFCFWVPLSSYFLELDDAYCHMLNVNVIENWNEINDNCVVLIFKSGYPFQKWTASFECSPKSQKKFMITKVVDRHHAYPIHHSPTKSHDPFRLADRDGKRGSYEDMFRIYMSDIVKNTEFWRARKSRYLASLNDVIWSTVQNWYWPIERYDSVI